MRGPDILYRVETPIAEVSVSDYEFAQQMLTKSAHTDDFSSRRTEHSGVSLLNAHEFKFMHQRIPEGHLMQSTDFIEAWPEVFRRTIAKAHLDPSLRTDVAVTGIDVLGSAKNPQLVALIDSPWHEEARGALNSMFLQLTGYPLLKRTVHLSLGSLHPDAERQKRVIKRAEQVVPSRMSFDAQIYPKILPSTLAGSSRRR